MANPEAASKAVSTALHWLNRSRVRVYSIGLLIAFCIFEYRTASYSWRTYGHPDGFDFVEFWAASRLTLHGNPLGAYSPEAMDHVALEISSTIGRTGFWLYPPNFLLMVWPLGLLPEPVSYYLFILGTSAFLIWLARRVLPMREALLPMLAFPALWLNASYGQNAALTASLIFAALLCLEKRPVLAGICIGLMSIKPQLVMLFPVVLICAGLWRVFFVAALTALAFTALSVGIFGTEIVPVFLASSRFATHLMIIGQVPWGQTASVFGAMRVLQMPFVPAMIVQGIVAVPAMVIVAWIWRACRAPETLALRALALVAGTGLASPYLFNYDLVFLGIPLVLCTAQALRTGWLRWERECFVAAWVYALAGNLVGVHLHVVFAPILFGALLWLAVRRARLSRNERAGY